MNLTKFMVYVKDVKLLKMDKSLTAKYLQQQFKTYFETSDKNIKDMIAKFDDTLKKNIAPQKKKKVNQERQMFMQIPKEKQF